MLKFLNYLINFLFVVVFFLYKMTENKKIKLKTYEKKKYLEFC